jgi:hypothetical protein
VKKDASSPGSRQMAGRFAPHFSLFFLFGPPAPSQSLCGHPSYAGGEILVVLLNSETKSLFLNAKMSIK